MAVVTDAGRAPVPELPVARLRGWGGGPGVASRLWRPDDLEKLAGALAEGAFRQGGAITRGMGRSYGDAAQLQGGVVIDLTGLKAIELDPSMGTVRVGASVTIGELLDEVAPRGWIVPVVPGTQHVTVGGAIASDIHGKNHGVSGTFGTHVQAMGLLRADGELVHLRPDDEGFAATLGGMGLTGVIAWATLALKKVTHPAVAVDTDRAHDLDEALALLSSPGGPYRVAWLDLLGRRPGRGVVTRADHASSSLKPAAATVSARATVPSRWPSGLLRPATVGAFNDLRFRLAPRHERGRIEPFGAHMFPLDAVRAWPRLYGRAGFVQYQLVVPPGREETLHRSLERLRAGQVPCYLAVLKDFGPANDAPLSFPLQGWTLALDLPRAAPGLDPALDELDRLVAEAGGRVYLTKDSRLRPDTVRAMYPRLDEWRAVRDRFDPEGVWRSDLSHRTGLTAR